MAAAIVQSAHGSSTVGTVAIHFASAVTAGHVLVAFAVRGHQLPTGSVYANGDITKPRTFTILKTVKIRNSDIAGPDYLTVLYRTATGDEQDITWFNSQSKIIVYDLSGASSPSIWTLLSQTMHAAGTTKTLGTLSPAGDAQLAGFVYDSGTADQSAGASNTLDWQYATGAHPSIIVEHSTTGAESKVSGTSHEWAGIAVAAAGAPAVVASFTATPLSGDATLAVTFTDTSTGTPTSWAWDFGDSGTSTSQNPSHNYTAAGNYTVSLTASKIGSSSTATLTEYVTVSAVPAAGVYADWDGDGFGTGSHDDLSSNVIGWTIRRGAGAEITAGADAGSLTLTLKDPSGLYNPFNASGALYGLIRDGVPVWIGINSDGKLTGANSRGLFGGRITDITPIPAGGATVPPSVEIMAEDLLGWARRVPIQLDYAEGRSHHDLRLAALLLADVANYDLAHEITTMPLSHVDTDLASALSAINGINGTRHLAKPADNFTDWYAYTTRNRQWRLDGTIDASLDASSDHVTGTDGWRLSADTVLNQQKAVVQPIEFTPGTFTVWQHEALPFALTDRNPVEIWVDFDDVVSDALLDIASTGDTVISSLDTFGTTGKVSLSMAPGDEATITALSIEGRLARRPPSVSFVADDTDSQGSQRGVRAGGEISGEYLGVLASARGIAQHVVWRYGNPQLRPTLTVENWFPEMFELDLYDVIAFTSTQLAMDARLFEIVGLTHQGNLAASTAQHHVTTYVLQECRVQADPGWFYLDDDPDSLLTDTAVLAY